MITGSLSLVPKLKVSGSPSLTQVNDLEEAIPVVTLIATIIYILIDCFFFCLGCHFLLQVF